MNISFFRYTKKNWVVAVVNAGGLAIGVAVFMLLAQWVTYELSYDHFHANSTRIFRPSMNINFAGQKKNVSRAQAQLLPWLQKNFTQIEKGTRLFNPSRAKPFVIRVTDQVYEERRFYYADSSFFDVFSFTLLKGNPLTALKAPKSVVLTEKIAAKYFGDSDPVGKGIEVNDEGEYLVTGVMKDIPGNSFLQPEFLGSFSTLPVSRDPTWGPAFYETYVVIDNPGDVKIIESKTNEMVAQLFRDETRSPGDYVKYDFMPFQKLYLTSQVQEGETTGSIQSVYLFGFVALVVLLVAATNYVNLSTALATNRAKELSIKKVAGAVRSQLIGQIMEETALTTLLSFLIAFVLVYLSLDSFNEATGKHFIVQHFVDFDFLMWIAALYFILVIVVGFYPAFVITSFKPVAVLKGNLKTSEDGASIRKWLLTFQFTASVALIAGSMIIMAQMTFIHQQNIGYDKDHTVILPMDKKSEKVYSQLRTELLNKAGVLSTSRSTETPIRISSAISINIEGESAVRQVLVNLMAIDTAFLRGLKIPVVQGRNFTDADVQSTRNGTMNFFILNEAAVKAVLPGKKDVIGARIDLDGSIGELVGVMKDFNFGPLHQPIGPLVFYPDDANFSWMYLQLRPENMIESVRKIQQVYQSLIPHRPFEFHFLDEQYDAQYTKEEQTASICNFFSGITLAISFIGLMGLITFVITQRTKEITVRTVLGASLWDIVFLLLADFRLTIATSIGGGGLIAYWLTSRWLDQFSYKVSPDFMPFLTSGLICLALFFGLILFHVYRVTQKNAAQVLRAE